MTQSQGVQDILRTAAELGKSRDHRVAQLVQMQQQIDQLRGHILSTGDRSNLGKLNNLLVQKQKLEDTVFWG